MKKKILKGAALLMALVMVIGTVGCGSKSSSNGSS